MGSILAQSMDRRTYLTAFCGSLTALSGCSELNSISPLNGDTRFVGEASTYEGVEFTPTRYLLTDNLRRNIGNGNDTSASASSGATFILTHLSVSHEGDSEKEFPSSRYSDDIELYYSDEEVSGGGLMDETTESYVVEGKELKTYGRALIDENASSGVYPGTEVDGWILHEVADNFDANKLELRVTWDNQTFGDSDGPTHKWTYTEDAKISIEEIEGEEDSIRL